MQAMNVNDALTEIIPAGNYPFIHIFNNSDVVIYISYDGQDVTLAAGMPVLPNQAYQLGNDGIKPIFRNRVTAIHASTGQQKEIRVQGV